jgi:hypothetical protein
VSPREQAEALILLRRWLTWARKEPLVAAGYEGEELKEATAELLKLTDADATPAPKGGAR